MVDVIKPTDEWVVTIVTHEVNVNCPFLVFPVNYHGCSFNHPSVFVEYPQCSKEYCPLKGDE